MSAVGSKDFTAIADAVEWVVRQDGVDFILHYLDNFYWLGLQPLRNAWVPSPPPFKIVVPSNSSFEPFLPPRP